MKLRDRVLSFLMITFQRDGSLLLEETSLDCKIGKRIIYRLKRFTYILRRQRKSLQWWVLKVKLKEERELEDGVFPFSLPHGELFFSLISNLYLRLYCQYQYHLRFWLLNVTLFHAGKTIVLTRHTFVGKVMSAKPIIFKTPLNFPCVVDSPQSGSLGQFWGTRQLGRVSWALG